MSKICDFNNQKPQISYPVFWEYKIIFKKEENVKGIINDIVKDRDFKLKFSKFSQNQKYQSHNLSVLVFNEDERLQLFSALKKVAKFVL